MKVEYAVREKRIRVKKVKLLRANGGCLGGGRRRRTCQAAISFGELSRSVDPEISEWGNPAGVISSHRAPNYIVEMSVYRVWCSFKFYGNKEVSTIKLGARGEPGEVKHLSTRRRRK